MNSSSEETKQNKKFSSVFIYSAIVVAIVVSIGAFYLSNSVKLQATSVVGLLKSLAGIT